MNEQLEELASLYVLDQLDARERATFEERLLREPELAAFVRDLESTVSAGIRALPQREPPHRALSQIERLVSDSHETVESTTSSRRMGPIRWVSFAGWGIAAVIALSLGTLAVQSLRNPSPSPMLVFVGLDANRNVFAELPLRQSEQDPDARFIQLASLAEKFWDKPGELPVKPNLNLTDGRGYALIDLSSMQGFIAVEQLPIIKESQRYHLWLLDPASRQIVDAGALPLAGTTSGLYSFILGPADSSPSARPNLFITVEDFGVSGAPNQPRGKVVLGDRGI